MTPNDKPVRPIIVIKKKISHGGHHGGAWKVAYADFVTAMMSLFIVLWLLNSTPQIQKAVAGYFNDPRGTKKETGTDVLGAGQSISIDKQSAQKLKEEIQKAILKQADLSKLSKQVEITLTSEGLKIELFEDKGGTFFQSGSPKLSDAGIALLQLLASQLKSLPNHLLIEGHTDAKPYSADNTYTNWELSSDRANSARRVLQQSGVGPTQISQVRGYADQLLRVASNPFDPSNRRISLIVQWAAAPADVPQPPADVASGAPPTPSASTRSPAAKPVPLAKDLAPPPNTGAEATVPAIPPPHPPAVQPTAHATTPTPRASLVSRIKSFLPGKKI